jgi:hypothetical protein
MPLPIVPIAIGAFLIAAAAGSKSRFQAVKGRKRKDGTVGKAYIRKKPSR